MKKIVAIAAFLLFTTSVSATYFEDNAEDVSCEWTDKFGNNGKDVCHITAQGTNMGETMTAFRIGNRVQEYVVTDNGFASLTVGKNKNLKTLWEGKSKQKWIPLKGTSAIQVIKLSDGMTVKLIRK